MVVAANGGRVFCFLVLLFSFLLDLFRAVRSAPREAKSVMRQRWSICTLWV